MGVLRLWEYANDFKVCVGRGLAPANDDMSELPVQRSTMIHSAKYTATHAETATVRSPLPNHARMTETARPMAADAILDVEYKIAGNVIAPSTAYGT